MSVNNSDLLNAAPPYDAEVDPNVPNQKPPPGSKRELFSGFVPNEEELEELVRYWTEEDLDSYRMYFSFGQIGGGNRRMFVSQRLAKLKTSLGDEAFNRVVAGVTEETRREMGPEKWRIFTRGSEEERARIVEENYRRFDYLDRKQQDVATCEKAFAYLRANPCGYFPDADGDLWSLAESPHVAQNCADRRLVLRVTTLSGGVACVPEYAMDRPAVWYPPFGLR